MTDQLKIMLAQLNPVVGDVEGNVAAIRDARSRAAEEGADLVVCGELGVVGYPPEDLILKPIFQRTARTAVEALAAETDDGGPGLVVGTPWVQDGKLYNAVALLDGGKVSAVRFKAKLPNYGVFDEIRVFEPGPMPGPVDFRGVRLGLMVCEDMWVDDVSECLEETGAEILIVINGSPYEEGKTDVRLHHAVARVSESGLPLIYVNQVGGQDELVFDGISFALNGDCNLVAQLPAWQEACLTTEWNREDDGWVGKDTDKVTYPEGQEATYLAMMTGLRDYVNKNRFPGVVLGMSGGIDSALSAAVAVDALGPDRVRCVMMPSRYTSQESLDDAAECADLLGASLESIAIGPAVEAFAAMLGPLFEGKDPDTTEENIQARIRGIILMGISNKFGPMVLTTGNKSEMSVGYATLYGDMCGGYSVLKDLYKMPLFEVSRWRNQALPVGALGPAGRVIPQNIIDKPPTAELRADQKDEDSLPPYAELDVILESLVEDEKAFAELVAQGHDPETVARMEHLLYISEYKRRQSPPGVKRGIRNYGRDRRYPITNGFRDARSSMIKGPEQE